MQSQVCNVDLFRLWLRATVLHDFMKYIDRLNIKM